MRVLTGILSLALILTVLWDAFETVVLPRRVMRRLRLTRFFYRVTWTVWAAILGRMEKPKRRDIYLGFYGPLSLFFLLSLWAVGLILGFALLQWSFGSRLNTAGAPATFTTDLYMSGTTFFTLGLGDVAPQSSMAKVLTVAESGTGFGFLALVISYLPVIYQAFSRREANITLLDARAGSPPSAAELLGRYGKSRSLEAIPELLRDWERWSADLLESHISYPVLAYFRSQHDNESWLSALTTILDTCALVIVGVDGIPPWQAQLTFAIARHAVVDLAQVFGTAPHPPETDRLSPQELKRLQEVLAGNGVSLRDRGSCDRKLTELRRMYEPYVNALSSRFLLALPPWIHPKPAVDNWRTSAWERISGGLVRSLEAEPDDHSG